MSSSQAGRRCWSLEGARLVLEDIRSRTERAVEQVERLEATPRVPDPQADGAAGGAERVQEALSVWVREMEALGVEVKGPWLVDFDCGSGYYCWRWPEQELAYFHGYGEGFASRVRIQ